jgi:hypothetical protein
LILTEKCTPTSIQNNFQNYQTVIYQKTRSGISENVQDGLLLAIKKAISLGSNRTVKSPMETLGLEITPMPMEISSPSKLKKSALLLYDDKLDSFKETIRSAFKSCEIDYTEGTLSIANSLDSYEKVVIFIKQYSRTTTGKMEKIVKFAKLYSKTFVISFNCSRFKSEICDYQTGQQQRVLRRYRFGKRNLQ